MLSAYAAQLLRIDADILSLHKKSLLSGAQFLHTEIPMLTGEPDGVIQTYKIGTKEGYASKVYGSPDAPCSWDLMEKGEHPAWSLRATYATLWDMYEQQIESVQIGPAVASILPNRYDLVISTIPAQMICGNPAHTFQSQTVWFEDKSSVQGLDGNYIVYNGKHDTSWYRSSSLFGVGQTEYSDHRACWEAEPPPASWQGIKPTTNNCNCHPRILRVGRFGKWQKAVLTHHAFREAFDAMQQL